MRLKINKQCVKCGKEKVTECDTCDKPTCRACSQIVVNKPTDIDVKIYHKGKCTPSKFRKEVKE
tara:strand:- start:13934 stop:14125 length:192 start_codon:yes stop_codon:yes gene_type:complete